MRKIAAYCRPSPRTPEIPAQRQVIKIAATARGDQVSVWYIDPAAGPELPQLARLRQHAGAHRVRRLYLLTVGALVTDTVDAALDLLRELLAADVEIKVVQDDLRLGTKGADAVIAALRSGARMERERAVQRVGAAKARVEAAGRRWGRPPVMTDRQCKAAKEMHRRKVPLRKIALKLKLARGTLWRFLYPKAETAVRQRRRAKAAGIDVPTA